MIQGQHIIIAGIAGLLVLSGAGYYAFSGEDVPPPQATAPIAAAPVKPAANPFSVGTVSSEALSATPETMPSEPTVSPPLISAAPVGQQYASNAYDNTSQGASNSAAGSGTGSGNKGNGGTGGNGSAGAGNGSGGTSGGDQGTNPSSGGTNTDTSSGGTNPDTSSGSANTDTSSGSPAGSSGSSDSSSGTASSGTDTGTSGGSVPIGTPSTGNGRAKLIGMNIQDINYYNSSYNFKNVAKRMTIWGNSYGNSPVFDSDAEVISDVCGTPVCDWQKHWRRFMFAYPKHFPPGPYVLTYDGDADFQINGAGGSRNWTKIGPNKYELYTTISNTLTTTAEGTYSYGDGWFAFVLTRNNSANPLRNMSIQLKSEVDVPGYWSPIFLREFQGFNTIRMMDIMHTNGSAMVRWNQRTKLTRTHWGNNTYGIPYETWIDLANRVHANVWVNIPFYAEDDYVTQLATLLHNTLDPELKVYIEYSNETWNWGFQQARDQAKMYAPGDVEGHYGWTTWTPWRSVQIFKLFNDVYGADKTRLMRVAPSQFAWVEPKTGATRSEFMLKKIKKYAAGDPYLEANALAVAPYMPDGRFTDSTGKFKGTGDLEKDLDSVFAEIYSYHLPLMKKYTEAQADMAKKYNVELVAYEFGIGMTSFGNGTAYENKLYTMLNRDPRMYYVVKQFLDTWFEAGGGHLNWFASSEIGSKWGNWNLGEFNWPEADFHNEPKRKAFDDYMADPANQ